MELNDLRTGMIVKTRDGKCYIVMRDFAGVRDILAGLSDSDNITNSYTELSYYNQDMKHNLLPELDIVSVYTSYSHGIDISKKLLWQREKYKEVTMQEIEEQFGCKVKIVGEQINNNELIPCKERLPEELEDVLVYFEYFRYGDYNCMYSTYGIGNQYEGRWHIDGYGKVNVFAWMPLPKPYKESEE